MILREIKNMYFPALQRIEYLESTEDYVQYIDTGVKIDSETAFQGSTIDFQILTLGFDDSVVVAGSVLSEGTHRYENTQCMVYEGWFYNNGGFDFSQFSDIYVRTTATSNGKAKGISNLNLILFARNVKGLGILRMINGQRGGTCRIFSCIIRKNGDVIRDFIPVRIGTKGYMLDKVSGELYGNSGTGDFVLGQDVGSINYSKNLQQIYQNKLIEGVDYETYDWLKGDGTPYIEWRANLWNNQLHTVIGKVKKNFIASKFELPNPTSSVLQISYNSNPASHGVAYLMVIFRSESNAYHIADISPFSAMPDVVDFKFYINNSVGYCVRNNVLFTGHNMATAWNDNVEFSVQAGKMKLLEEYDYVNDKLISSLVPCQLLKPIPRNLDAQCKERVAGECGMIDLISGKFYGNVANSGTFTVENDNE